MRIKYLIKNKILIYLSTRYLTYGVQFIISLIIAIRLGPYFLGIYGMVLLIQSYLNQINWGIPHSLNVILVHTKDNILEQKKLIFNSIVLYTYTNIIILLITIILYLSGHTEWGKYDLSKLLYIIIISSILTYYNNIASTVLRFNGNINLLSLIGSIPVILNLLVIGLFSEWKLVVTLAVVNLLSSIIILILVINNKVFSQLKFEYFSFYIQKHILHKGLFLFLYNSCFYFILMSIRTIVSESYPIEYFGYFTFSFTIANAVLLLLDSLNTIIFPKTIDLLSRNSENYCTLKTLRIGYITTAHLLIYLALFIYPYFLTFLPQYKNALMCMCLVSLSVLMNTNSYGYNTLLIAKNKEKICSAISVVALLTAIGIGLVLTYVIKVDYQYVVISVLIAYLIFSLISFHEGNKLLRENNQSFVFSIKNFFPIKLLIPYAVALIIVLLQLNSLLILPLMIFIILNIKDLKYLKSIIIKLLKRPNIIDIS